MVNSFSLVSDCFRNKHVTQLWPRLYKENSGKGFLQKEQEEKVHSS